MSDPINKVDPKGTGPLAAVVVGSVCTAVNAYDAFSSLRAGAQVTAKISALQSANASLNSKLSGCGDVGDQGKILSQIQENNVAIAQLSLMYAKFNSTAMTAIGFESLCAAAAAAAFITPSP